MLLAVDRVRVEPLSYESDSLPLDQLTLCVYLKKITAYVCGIMVAGLV